MKVQGHTFLITGGGSGLGAACAARLVEHGARILIADVNADVGQAAASKLGDAARFLRTDVTQEGDVVRAIDAAAAFAGKAGLRGAISCAGIAPANRLITREGPHPLPLFEQAIEVNLLGTFHVMRTAANAMAGNEPDEPGERGILLNTASIAAFEGQVGQTAYAASKGGVAAMTLPAARDLAKLGIRVVAIAPGIFDTPMLAAMPQEVRNALLEQTVFPKRFGQADEFASLVEHVITNPMLNGTVIRLDGAVRMSAK